MKSVQTDVWVLTPSHMRGLFVVILLVCIAPSARAAMNQEFVATDHWAYGYIQELYASGPWGSWPIATRPWSRGDITARLAEIVHRDSTEHNLTRAERYLVDRLKFEFSDDLVHTSDTCMDVRAGAEAFGGIHSDEFADPIYRGRIQGFAGTGTGIWWVRMRGDIDSHGELDPTFFGKEWKDKFTGTVDIAYFTLRTGGFELELGRDFLRWGPSPNDALVLNDQSPPFNMARFAYHHRLFNFSFFFTGLDSAFSNPADDPATTGPDVNRYMSGHRLEVRPSKNLQLGMSETVLYGGPGRQLEAYYLNPFLPYYWEQLNADVDDNPVWSVDFSWRIPRGPMLYGEWLIDDFQIDFESEAHQVGWSLGFDWLGLPALPGSFVTADWTHNEPSVYNQVLPYNRYLNHRVGMGSILGPDAERLLLNWRQHVSRALDVSLRGQLEREGEAVIDEPLVVPIQRDQFPSGVVQATTETELGVFYQPSRRLRFDVRAGYRWIDNPGNVPGTAQNGGFVSASVSITDWITGSF